MESNKGKQLQDWHIAVQYFFVVWVVKYSTGLGPPICGCELRWKVLRTGKTSWANFFALKTFEHIYLITKFMFCVRKRPFSTVFSSNIHLGGWLLLHSYQGQWNVPQSEQRSPIIWIFSVTVTNRRAVTAPPSEQMKKHRKRCFRTINMKEIVTFFCDKIDIYWEGFSGNKISSIGLSSQ